MAYCTEDEVRSSLGKIIEDDLSSADILDIIEEASSFIDSHIIVRYALPLATPVPAVLERICRDLSACWLYDDIIAGGMVVEEETKVHARCKRATSTLEALRDGIIRLVNSDGSTVTESTGASALPWSNSTEYSHPQFFDKDDDTDWAFNTDEIEDIDGERE